MPATFGDIYEQLCERYPDPLERGRRFEPLVADILRTDRMFRERYSQVWLWDDWPDRESGDIGVDIVAELADGSGYAAIQCKCYEPTTTLQKSHLNSFLAYTNPDFVERIVVSTTSNWSSNLLTLMRRQQPPVQRLDLFGLEATTIDWDRYLEDETKPLQQRRTKELRPHQEAALSDVYAGFEQHDRGKLIMACGTGKTFTALRAAEQLAGKGGRVLFAAPSISLVNQSLREWAAESRIPIRVFAVCSDPKVGRANDGDSARTYDLPIPATTDARRLADEASKDAPNRLTVVFSTYQSMQRIAEAQDAGMPAFDLVICDEAHRTTGATLKGEERSNFLLVHDAEKIRAKKRLYMTATPRLYAVAAKKKAEANDIVLASMDDEGVYGPEFHRLGFAQAVNEQLLSDYKVAILVISEGQINLEYSEELGDSVNVGDVGRVIGCLNGLAKHDPEGREFQDDPQPMRRAVAFSNTIANSKHFVNLVAQLQDDAGRSRRDLQAEAKHVDGTSGVLERADRLRWLGGETMMLERQCHVLSNARCLTEGIDVPSLDAVLFLQPRKSQIDVVQAVGRVMRRTEDKKWGYIILPVVVPADEDPSQALDKNDAYAHVWQVLQALRSHDDRLDAWVNKLDLNKERQGPICVIGVGPGGGESEEAEGESDPVAQGRQLILEGIDEQLAQWRDAIYAQIVTRCGERRYWKQWAASVADIASRLHNRIHSLITRSDTLGKRFDEFVASLRRDLNDSITKDDAAAMLAQHLITKPVFDALFGGSDFTESNPVSRAMQRMVDALAGEGLDAETAQLSGFYENVRLRVQGIDNAEGRRRVANELYENFFREAFPKDAERLGIVYTPLEIVDFVIRAVSDLLQREFGASLGDKGVHILDPFTGTGTFIAQLLQSGLIGVEDLRRKYRTEIHANEIMLLAYYIAAVNIENAYRDAMAAHDLDAGYEPFKGIVLTDTFQMTEPGERQGTGLFANNSEQIERQLGLDIRVIIGNPPWSVGQRSAHDDNPNQPYPALDAAISQKYVVTSTAGTKYRSVYDSYVRAIRWASDRVLASDNGGIVTFVTNSGFIDAKAFDGMRKTLVSEFHAIHIFNLRGNQRTSGEQSRREGGKVFGAGSRAGVAILLLVKRAGSVPASGAVIRHRDIGDYLTREQKLAIVSESGLNSDGWLAVEPNEHGDWINQRSDQFLDQRPLSDLPSQPAGKAAIFGLASGGLATSRDLWVYGSSGQKLRRRVKAQVDFYNEQAKIRSKGESWPLRDHTRFKWDERTERSARRGNEISVQSTGFTESVYRPFFAQCLYMEQGLNYSAYQLPSIFPEPKTRTPSIIVESKLRTAGRVQGVLGTDRVPNAAAVAGAAGHSVYVFPRYVYGAQAENEKSSIFSVAGRVDRRSSAIDAPRDNITDQALTAYQSRYGEDVISDHIFAYVYGILHSTDYRERYATDLARMLPRIPEVSTADAFYAFAEAGQDLLDLHIGYEEADPYPLEEVWSDEAPTDDKRWYVRKMKWAGTSKAKDQSAIVVNDWLTLRGIPEAAHRYVVGPRSALEWLIDRYRIRTDKPSGIVNDPNDWGLELDPPQPDYIPTLIKRIVTVSLETMQIVDSLPPLEEAD